MTSFEFWVLKRFLLSFFRHALECFESFAPHFPLASNAASTPMYYAWFLGVDSRFTLCRVFSVAFGHADTNLLYAYNMLNGN